MHSEMMTIADELDRAMQAYRGTGISLRSHKLFIHVLTCQFVRVYCHLYVAAKPSGTVAMQDGSMAPPTA